MSYLKHILAPQQPIYATTSQPNCHLFFREGPDANEASLVDVGGRNSKTNLLTRSRLRGMTLSWEKSSMSRCPTWESSKGGWIC